MQNPLKPTSFDEFVGQKLLIANLRVLIKAAQMQNRALDHIMFYGPPGLGKTTLASIIASEANFKIRFVQGPMIDKKADFLSIFGSLSKNEIIFIDEIHGINKNVEELFYSAIGEGYIDLIIGVEGNSKVVRMKLPSFTLIGATTKIGKVSLPLKDRFGFVGKLEAYSLTDLELIVKQSALRLKFNITNPAAKLIAATSRNTPRVANTILRRAYDFAIINKWNELSLENAHFTLEQLGIYSLGLDEQHIHYLKTLSDAFNNSWASLDAISGIIIEEKFTIESQIEPVLLQNKLIEKSSRGRRITSRGVNYLIEYNLKPVFE